ncbi:MAG: class I SAM-dependent methyltransferase [Proteobacteria bacterium]|jgi:SAM-dependent methyltransferase|nr:class I SAM-dependent methyltransferase [Pseudomonadota bacterium]
MSVEAFYQAAEPNEYQQSLLGLYNKSILKQAKFAAINKYLASTETCRCLDVGADNGVLSYLLRKKGGDWSSADLEPSVVASIQQMVGNQVELFDGGRTQYADQTFDIVVIIDFLEHIEDDRAFLAELNRIMKPGGQLIINVPHFRKNSWIRKLRLACGLSDEKHGHVRPGYNLLSLQGVCNDYFEITASHTYSKFFVELYDVFISLLFERMAKGGGGQSNETNNETSKGVVVTGDDLNKHRKKFKLFSVIYPFVWSLAQFDKLLFWTQGHSLIVMARKPV